MYDVVYICLDNFDEVHRIAVPEKSELEELEQMTHSGELLIIVMYIIIFMAHRAIPMIAFHGVETIYIFVSICATMHCIRSCVIPGGCQLMGVARNTTRTIALLHSFSSMKKDRN